MPAANSRLICVSNRIPTGPSPSGGLVVALEDVLKRSGGIWIGSDPDGTVPASDELVELEGGPFRRLAFHLPEEERENFYVGQSNSMLWPLFHDRTDLIEISREYVAAYRDVNGRIARIIKQVLRPDDRIWVHDYHLLPLAHELREIGVRNPIGFFLHTPFPTPLALEVMPSGQDMCAWLTRYDLVGLQAERDVVNAIEAMQRVGGAVLRADGRLELDGHAARFAAFPIGIDSDDFADLAEREFDKLPSGVVNQNLQLMMGVDRLDYTKGIPQRLRAYKRFLEEHEDWLGRVSVLQISPPTREGVPAYDEIRAELELLCGQINGQFADITWTPVRYIHRNIPREQLAGLYRAAHVGLVTPLMDGMNLVAKEFIAAQNPEDPGVLILSRFAGAAEQMQDALLVNPHDEAELADAMGQALTMPLGERRERYTALMGGLRAQDVHWWSNSFLAALEDEVTGADRAQPAPQPLAV